MAVVLTTLVVVVIFTPVKNAVPSAVEARDPQSRVGRVMDRHPANRH